MKRILAAFFCVCLCLTLFSSCSKEPEINRKIMPMSTSGSITYGIYGLDGEIETAAHFQIESGAVFEKIFSFGNMIEYQRDYKLLIFAHYQQIEFSVNDAKASSFHDFTTQPKEHIQFTFTLPPLADGFYDLLLLIVKDPDNENLDEAYRKQTDLSHLTSMRFSLQVGTSDFVPEEPALLTCDATENNVLDGIFLNQDGAALRRLLTLECARLEEPALFVHVGNQSDSEKCYVVFLLYDWQQIPIASQDLLYVSVPQHSRVTLPVSLNVLEESGVHNLTAVCVEEPFQEATRESRRADFSIRVGINVKD